MIVNLPKPTPSGRRSFCCSARGARGQQRSKSVSRETRSSNFAPGLRGRLQVGSPEDQGQGKEGVLREPGRLSFPRRTGRSLDGWRWGAPLPHSLCCQPTGRCWERGRGVQGGARVLAGPALPSRALTFGPLSGRVLSFCFTFGDSQWTGEALIFGLIRLPNAITWSCAK